MASYGLLFLIGDPQTSAHTAGMSSLLDLHLKGMWFAMGLTSISIVAFVQRIRRQLYERDRQISQLAAELGCSTAQLALAWCASSPLTPSLPDSFAPSCI